MVEFVEGNLISVGEKVEDITSILCALIKDLISEKMEPFYA